MSKHVTVTLAMPLVDAGRLLLDDTLARRWPAFQAPGAAQITVRHLMQHLSGLAQPGDGRAGRAFPIRRLNKGRAQAMAVALDAGGQPVPQPVMATYGAASAMEGTARGLWAFNRALLAGRLVSAASRQAMWTGEPKWGYAALGVWAFAAPHSKVPCLCLPRDANGHKQLALAPNHAT